MERMLIYLVKVNGLEYGASVGIGPTLNVGVQAATKNLLANGTISGDYGFAPNMFGIINDPDVIDTPEWHLAGPS